MTNLVYDKNMAVVKIDALFEPTMKILVGLSYTIGLGYGAFLVFENKLTLGDLVTFNVYLGMLIWPMFAIGELINLLQRGNASIDRVYEVLEYKETTDLNSPRIKVPTVLSIDFKEVTFRYPSASTNQLRHLSLHIKKGQTIGIVGKTDVMQITVRRVFKDVWRVSEL